MVISLHGILRFEADLCPWKGGGFGMFAYADRLENREISAVVSSSGREVNMPLIPSGQLNTAKSFPTKRTLGTVAMKACSLLNSSASPLFSPISGVRVDVWKVVVLNSRIERKLVYSLTASC
jgi:hypothetical protein